MSRTGQWRLAAAIGVLIALALPLLVLVTSEDDDDGAPGETVEAATTSTTRPTSTSTSTTFDPSTSFTAASTTSTTTTSGVTATTRAPARAAPRAPTTTTTTTATTTSRPATTTTTVTTTTAPPGDGCAGPGASSSFNGFGAAVVTTENSSGDHEACMLTADTPGQQRQGLMNQDDLDGYAGMIFRFDDERERSFWMRNTRIPLSIAFFDADGRFVSATDMEPCGDSDECPSYSSDGPAQYAIEVPQGRLASVGATSGSRTDAGQ